MLYVRFISPRELSSIKTLLFIPQFFLNPTPRKEISPIQERQRGKNTKICDQTFRSYLKLGSTNNGSR